MSHDHAAPSDAAPRPSSTPKDLYRKNRKNTPEYLHRLAETARMEMLESVTRLIDQVHANNLRLAELDTEIRTIQPRTHGSIVMQRYGCGTHGELGCIGCPHIRWEQWFDTSAPATFHLKNQDTSRKTKRWVRTRRAHPLRHIYRSGRFAEVWEDVKRLIQEAIRVDEDKKRLLKHVTVLRRAQSHHQYRAWKRDAEAVQTGESQEHPEVGDAVGEAHGIEEGRE